MAERFFGKTLQKDIAIGFTEHYFADPVPCPVPTSSSKRHGAADRISIPDADSHTDSRPRPTQNRRPTGSVLNSNPSPDNRADRKPDPERLARTGPVRLANAVTIPLRLANAVTLAHTLSDAIRIANPERDAPPKTLASLPLGPGSIPHHDDKARYLTMTTP